MMTIIIIAHRLSTIIGAQKIYVMKEGYVVEEGNHNSLLEKDGYYSELFSKQIQKSVAPGKDAHPIEQSL